MPSLESTSPSPAIHFSPERLDDEAAQMFSCSSNYPAGNGCWERFQLAGIALRKWATELRRQKDADSRDALRGAVFAAAAGPRILTTAEVDDNERETIAREAIDRALTPVTRLMDAQSNLAVRLKRVEERENKLASLFQSLSRLERQYNRYADDVREEQATARRYNLCRSPLRPRKEVPMLSRDPVLVQLREKIKAVNSEIRAIRETPLSS